MSIYSITIRPEAPQDYFEVEQLARDSSVGYYQWETDAHLHVHKTRRHRRFIPELSFVAQLDGKLAGMIMYTKSEIVTREKTYGDTLCLQHLRVAPWAQCRGVGTALVRHTLPLVKAMGYRAVLFHGNPDYYPRLGFHPAFNFGIGKEPSEHFHCMPLYDGALDGISRGRHIAMDIKTPKWQVRLFDRKFPPVDFTWVKPVDYLLNRLEPPARKAIEEGLPHLHTLYQMCRTSEALVAALPGIDEAALSTIRAVMRECNYGWGREHIERGAA